MGLNFLTTCARLSSMPKHRQLIFIDDSGDPGFKKESSSNFVMAAVVFNDVRTVDMTTQEIDNYRRQLGWQSKHEFKFTKNPKNIVETILQKISKYDFDIYATYIQKSNFKYVTPKLASFLDKEKLYNWLLKELVQIIPLYDCKIIIDGRSNKEYIKKTITFLRQSIKHPKTTSIQIKFEDSTTNSLLQLADLVVSSINRSLQPEKTDSRKYISIIRDKIIKQQKIQCF